MKRIIWRYLYSLFRNNNTRMKTLWFITGLLLAFNFYFFGNGENFTTRSEEVQRLYNGYFKMKFVTDLELAPKAPARFWQLFGPTFWKIWRYLLLFSTFYTFIAMRDEVARSWRRAVRTVRERRGEMPEERRGDGRAGQATFGFWRIFRIEILAEFLSDLFFGTLKRVRRRSTGE